MRNKLIEPIDMMLFCPKCGLQHIDAPDARTPDWDNPPHRSHLCHGCGCIWRPADIPTNGVAGIQTRGSKDTVFYNRAAIAAYDTDDRIKEWQPIETAPLDGTAIQARIPGHGEDNIIAWVSDALYDEDERPCGSWSFVTEQEPPDCWTDGWCWASNEDGVRSAWPTHWKHLPEDIAHD
jgi:hypothetical protein